MAKTQQVEKPSEPIVVSDANFSETTKKHPLVFVDFWAEWCGPCRMMGPIVDELAKEYAGRVVFAKLNVDENQETASNFGVMSIPTFVIMKGGSEAARLVGAMPKEKLKEELQKYVK